MLSLLQNRLNCALSAALSMAMLRRPKSNRSMPLRAYAGCVRVKM